MPWPSFWGGAYPAASLRGDMPEATGSPSTQQAPLSISWRRRATDHLMTGVAILTVVLVLAPLVAIFGYLVYRGVGSIRSEEHTSELQSLRHLVCRLLLE